MFSDYIAQKVLFEPPRKGADRLLILSAYAKA